MVKKLIFIIYDSKYLIKLYIIFKFWKLIELRIEMWS